MEKNVNLKELSLEELKIYYKKNRQEIREKNRQKEELVKRLNGD